MRGGCACSPARASSRPMLVLACWQIHQDGKPKPAEPDSGVPDSSEPDSSKCKAERLKKLNEELNVQSKFRSNGLDAAFEWRYGDGEAKLSVEELRFCATLLECNMRAHIAAARCGSMVRVPPLAVPQLGPCASSGHTWRLWAARHLPGRCWPTARWKFQPLPWLLEPAA